MRGELKDVVNARNLERWLNSKISKIDFQFCYSVLLWKIVFSYFHGQEIKNWISVDCSVRNKKFMDLKIK